ncbi:hypothetical protein SeMB42_g07048 [Synchytrium endobioticum]|uniref:Rhodanese domain-containing protein n=1 Tax=Synchytrium endobioticum TaxID=286115 RepID=A0A507CGM1_9FUNG|nr:hypothetical protein SeMB42_g07048 [Synchytrium endobioticum]
MSGSEITSAEGSPHVKSMASYVRLKQMSDDKRTIAKPDSGCHLFNRMFSSESIKTSFLIHPSIRAYITPGSINIPVKQLASRIGEIESRKTDPVVCVCRSGVRSNTAASILIGSQFDNVYSLKGGVLACNKA